jgi:histidinol-phosphatase
MGYEDLAPLPVIVAEAGGRVTDLSGGPVLSGDGTVLATNGHLHDDYLALLAGLPTSRAWPWSPGCPARPEVHRHSGS